MEGVGGAVPKLRQSMEVRKKAWLIEELHFGGKGVNGGE